MSFCNNLDVNKAYKKQYLYVPMLFLTYFKLNYNDSSIVQTVDISEPKKVLHGST